METKNDIYEITKLVSDKESIENDFLTALNTLKDCLQKKYVHKLYSIVDSEQHSVVKNPPKEIKLLQALKGFVPSENHERVDNAINMLMLINTASKIHSDVYETTEKNPSLQLYHINSQSEDKDSKNIVNCNNNAELTSLLLTLALFKKI